MGKDASEKSGRPKGPTSADVAKAAGVSRATVSYVINQRAAGRIPTDTQERVLRAAESVGYRRNRLAAALSTGRTYSVALVSALRSQSDVAALPEIYLKNLFLAVTIAAARAGLNVSLLVETPEQEIRPDEVADGRVDGAIVFRSDDPEGWVSRMVALGLPCVEIGTRQGRYAVDVDNAAGAGLAVEHLVGIGHRRVVFYNQRARNQEEAEAVLSLRERAAGFHAATRVAGIPDDDAPIVDTRRDLRALFAPGLPLANRPTAVFAFNDDLAVTALDVLTEAGLRVPEDVSLVGFNNDVRAITMRPKLTTVINPIDEIARTAVALLRRQIEGDAPPTEMVSVPPPGLVVRDSTIAPRRGN